MLDAGSTLTARTGGDRGDVLATLASEFGLTIVTWIEGPTTGDVASGDAVGSSQSNLRPSTEPPPRPESPHRKCLSDLQQSNSVSGAAQSALSTCH